MGKELKVMVEDCLAKCVKKSTSEAGVNAFAKYILKRAIHSTGSTVKSVLKEDFDDLTKHIALNEDFRKIFFRAELEALYLFKPE